MFLSCTRVRSTTMDPFERHTTTTRDGDRARCNRPVEAVVDGNRRLLDGCARVDGRDARTVRRVNFCVTRRGRGAPSDASVDARATVVTQTRGVEEVERLTVCRDARAWCR